MGPECTGRRWGSRGEPEAYPTASVRAARRFAWHSLLSRERGLCQPLEQLFLKGGENACAPRSRTCKPPDFRARMGPLRRNPERHKSPSFVKNVPRPYSKLLQNCCLSCCDSSSGARPGPLRACRALRGGLRWGLPGGVGGPRGGEPTSQPQAARDPPCHCLCAAADARTGAGFTTLPGARESCLPGRRKAAGRLFGH